VLGNTLVNLLLMLLVLSMQDNGVLRFQRRHHHPDFQNNRYHRHYLYLLLQM
jgi:hypothetical protein